MSKSVFEEEVTYRDKQESKPEPKRPEPSTMDKIKAGALDIAEGILNIKNPNKGFGSRLKDINSHKWKGMSDAN